MKIPNLLRRCGGRTLSLARIVSEDSQPPILLAVSIDKSSKDS